MSSDSLENEDLDNVPLVRMEDVQPSRDRVLGSRAASKEGEEVYETCIIDDIEYENECIVNDDDDSNIGSMVSLHSTDVYEDSSSREELIIPEVLEQPEIENDKDDLEVYDENEQVLSRRYLHIPVEDGKLQTLEVEELQVPKVENLDMPSDNVDEQFDNDVEITERSAVAQTPSKASVLTTIEIEVPPNKIKNVNDVIIRPRTESWPTLEILPGGVIKNTDKYVADSYLYPDKVQESVANMGEMMYACAKCSQTFKYLFCLVKHVKWHEDQKKTLKDPKVGTKQKSSANQYICLHSGKKKIVVSERNKRKTPKRLKS